MPLAPSFADTFRPRRQSTVGPSLPMGLGSGMSSEFSRDMRLTREQARHCRLWNYIAIDANSQKASEDQPYVGYLVDGERVAEPNHPLTDLFQYCNGVDFWQGFAYEMFLQFGLFRRIVLWANPNGLGLPAELWVIPTPWAEPKVDRDGVIHKWTITPSGGVPFHVDASEIICIQGKHPTSKSVPLSPTEAGGEWILSSEIVERARHQTYEHGPLQSMLIEIDKDVHGAVTPELLDAVGEKFMARYRGFAQAGRPIVQPPGVKAVPWSVKPNEMLTGEQADQLRDNVLALHKVPRFAVGIAHDLNKATAEVSERVWYNTAINPMRRFVAGALTEYLAKLYDPDLIVWFEDLCPDDTEARRLDFAADAKEGIASVDELRVQRGYDALGTPEAQQPIIYAKLAAAAKAKEPTDKPEPGEETEEDEEPEAQSLRVIRQNAKATTIIRAFEATHDQAAADFEKRASAFLSALSKEVLARWDAGARTIDDLCPNSVVQAGFNSVMTPGWERSTQAGALWELSSLGKSRISQEAPSIRVPIPPRMQRQIDEWVKSRQAGIWSIVAETTRTDMARAIKEGIGAGRGMDEIRRRVQQVINDKARAATIAQTEATASINSGAQILRHNESVKKKTWLATFDGHTRPSHAAAMSQVVDNDQPFVVGGYRMMFPGDSSFGAPAAEVVRCRCCATGALDDAVPSSPYLISGEGDVRSLIGVQPTDLPRLIGAPSGTAIEYGIGKDGRVFVAGQKPGEIMEMVRHFARGSDGRIEVENESFYLHEGAKGKHLGTRVFARQVKELRMFGASRIHTVAHRGDGANGYYTWARLGYDAPLPSEIREMLPSSLASAARVSDLMRTAEGREWWKKYGDSIEMTFDLTNGSLSLRVLDEYLRQKGL